MTHLGISSHQLEYPFGSSGLQATIPSYRKPWPFISPASNSARKSASRPLSPTNPRDQTFHIGSTYDTARLKDNGRSSLGFPFDLSHCLSPFPAKRSSLLSRPELPARLGCLLISSHTPRLFTTKLQHSPSYRYKPAYLLC